MFIRLNHAQILDFTCFQWRSAQLVRFQAKRLFKFLPILGQNISEFRPPLIGLMAEQLILFTHFFLLFWVVH